MINLIQADSSWAIPAENLRDVIDKKLSRHPTFSSSNHFLSSLSSDWIFRTKQVITKQIIDNSLVSIMTVEVRSRKQSSCSRTVPFSYPYSKRGKVKSPTSRTRQHSYFFRQSQNTHEGRFKISIQVLFRSSIEPLLFAQEHILILKLICMLHTSRDSKPPSSTRYWFPGIAQE